MFICQITGRQSDRNEKLNKLVVRTRDRVYTKKIRNEETRQLEEIEIGRGWEIVQELNTCQEGLDLWNGWTPEEREAFLKGLH